MACTVQVWAWKEESYASACNTFVSQTLTAAEREDIDLGSFPGYYEAGSALSAPLRVAQVLCLPCSATAQHIACSQCACGAIQWHT